VLDHEASPSGAAESRYVHGLIPGAELALVSGDPYVFPFDNRAGIAEAVRQFVSRRPVAESADTVLSTVLFTDIVGSTERAAELGDRRWHELLEEHHAVVRGELARARGREIDTAGDGFFAAFDGPARAVRCAKSIVDGVRDLGLDVRSGLHTGECGLVDGKVAGIAVHTGARVAAHAGPGEVLVSSTVKDLVAGSGLAFEDRGVHELKGIPGEWRLYAAV
jgi:class 3 adenylate cyclase